MKKRFENTKLLYVVFLFLMIKIFCTGLLLFHSFFLILASYLPWIFFIASIFSENGILLFILGLLVLCVYFAATVLLVINRRGAGVASILLIILCLFDALVVFLDGFFFGGFVGFLFQITIAVMLLLLWRRKREAPFDPPQKIDLKNL